MELGIYGALLILIAFITREKNINFRLWPFSFRIEEPDYFTLNIIGSFCLVIYGIRSGVWPFVFLNGIWLGHSIIEEVKKIKGFSFKEKVILTTSFLLVAWIVIRFY